MSKYIAEQLWFKFFEQLNNSSGEDAVDVLKLIHNSVAIIADAIKIARIEYSVTIIPSAFFPNGQTNNTTLYQSNEPVSDTNPFVKNIITRDRKKIIITIFIRDGNPEWNLEQKHDLILISNTLHSVLEKSQLSDIVAKAVSNDVMTGLLNIDSLMDIGFSLERRQKLINYCACMFNLKNFKYVNQILPYHDGNRIMIEYCHILSEALTENNYLARIGGDNFAALISKDNINNFINMLHNVDVSIQTNLDIKNFSLSASCGYAEAAHDACTIKELLQFASDALHVAKNVLHEDTVRYTNDIKEFVVHERSITLLFKPSVFAHEFVPFYQMRVNISNGTLSGNEALVRWIHSKNTMLPEDFIPTLERDGSIEKLDYIVLEQVCSNIADLLVVGNNPNKVTVNFSGIHLINPHFTRELAGILTKYKVDPSLIEIEFSEAMPAKYMKLLVPVVQELKIYGFSISIDHYGEGPSSLHLLKDMPIDTIVFSRKFLLENYTGIQGSLLIESAVNIAKAYFVRTVACGIDNEQLLKYVKNIGFDSIQGNIINAPYVFSRNNKAFTI